MAVQISNGELGLQRYCLCLLGTLLLGIAAAEATEWMTFAVDATTHQRQQQSIVVGASKTTTFRAAGAFPDDHWIDTIAAQLPPDWRACDYGARGWEHYHVETGGGMERISRRISVWANPNKKAAVVLSLLYAEAACVNSQCPAPSGELRVTVVENRAQAYRFWQNYSRVCPQWIEN